MTPAARLAGACVLLLAGACAPGGAGEDAPSAAGAPRPSGSRQDRTAASTGSAAGAHAGSPSCTPCHPVIAGEWAASSHATTVRAASIEDEDRLESFIECAGLPVTHVLGDRHHVRYLVRDESVPWREGRWLALPCGWDVHEEQVTSHHPETWRSLPWESGCAACHSTGFSAADHSFEELGVGCEACHGPAAEHARTAERSGVLRFGGQGAVREVTACAACHLQGGRSKTTGLRFPHAFRPGGALLDDYEFDWTTLDDPDALVLDLHQKHLVKAVLVDGDESLRCTSCHAMHGLGHEKHQALERRDYCSLCHELDLSLKEYSQSCNVCEF